MGDAYDREVLLELPLTGTECRTVIDDKSPANVLAKIAYEHRGSMYLATYYGNNLLLVDGTITMANLRKLLAETNYDIFVAEEIYESLTTSNKRFAKCVDAKLGLADDFSSDIVTNSIAVYYLDGECGLAKTALSKAALCMNKVLSNGD